MKEDALSITPSSVIEYLFCPRFIYFMEVLKISQHEDQRYKVRMGREIHRKKTNENVGYLRKKLNVKDKLVEMDLFSTRYRIHGKVDEILFFEDGTGAPLDYKFAKFEGRIYKTHKTQSIMYGLLIMENYNIPVNRGYIVYTRSKHHIEEIEFTQRDIKKTIKAIEDILEIILLNYYPKKTSNKNKCFDCCYRNICV